MNRAQAIRGGLALALGGVVAIAAPARPAHACGDGGDGGSSTSGSSTSGSSSSGSSSSGSSAGGSGSDSSPVYEPACVDGTTVVGYRTCAPYGAWSTTARLPKVSFEIGPWSSMIDLEDVAVAGSVMHSDGTSYAYRIVGSELGGQADVIGVRSRLLAHRGVGYVGLEGGVGGVVTSAIDRRTPMAAVELESRTAAVATGGVVIGARIFIGQLTAGSADRAFVGRLSLGGEVMAGVRAVSVTSTSTHGSCVVDDLQWSGAPTIEVRARGELWLTPWLTAGGYLGRDALGGQTSAGLDLGFHLRAFDGR